MFCNKLAARPHTVGVSFVTVVVLIPSCFFTCSPSHFMRGRELSTLVVILSFQEFTLRLSNLNIVCSEATSLFS